MAGFNVQEMMKMARQQYEQVQQKMRETVVEGTSGGGLVKAKMDGSKQVLSLKLDPEVVKSGDIEMLEDLIVAAVNAAGKQVDAALQSSMAGMMGGLQGIL